MNTYTKDQIYIGNKYLYCPNCNSFFPINTSNKNLEKNIINFMTTLYSNIKSFQEKILNNINSIKNITSSLDNHTNHSKSLLKLIVIKNNNYIERYRQLSDRIDMINQSKKILEDNLFFANESIKIFMDDVKQLFIKMNQKIKETKYIESNINGNISLDYKKQNIINNTNPNQSNEIERKKIYENKSPQNKLNFNKNKFTYTNLDNFVDNIQLDEYNQKIGQIKSNNTLIFPNNINQNIYNYNITSREFQKLNKNKTLPAFRNTSSNKNKSDNTNSKGDNKIKIGMINSINIPDMNHKYIEKMHGINNYDDNKIIELCNKVREFIDYFNNDTFEESNVLLKKIDDINILINIILERKKNNYIESNKKYNNRYSNINIQNKNDVKSDINFNENNNELIKNIQILNDKINELEGKVREKEEYIRYLKKLNKNINNKNNSYNKEEYGKEDANSKNELNEQNNLYEENQILKKEIEEQRIKIKELSESQKLLKIEIEQKEKIIAELNESIKNYMSQNKEKDYNLLKEKNEEYKNTIKEKNKIIQEINNQTDKYKNEINDLNIKLKHFNDESQLVMEISSLKKINNNLNKKLNEFKKKLNPNSNLNSSLENDLDIISLKDNYKELFEENNEIKTEKERLKVENNIKEEEIKKLKNIIDELNQKINEYSDKKINSRKKSDSDSFSLSNNSIGFDIINLGSQDINKLNIEDFKKQNEKIIKLKEMFEKYKSEKQIEISIYKNEFETTKKEINELKMKLNENNAKIYSSENYNILCDKNYKNLQWLLLIPKSKSFSNTYEDLIWIPRKKILNIENFNNYISEYEAQNKILADNLSKLEKKEEIISKLKYKINCYEKNVNHTEEISNTNIDISSIGIEKMNKIIAELNNTENKLKILQSENKQLKEELSKRLKDNKKSKPNSTDDSNKLAYNKKYKIEIEGDNNNINNIKNEDIKENEEEENENEGEESEETESVLNELRYELENTKIKLDSITNEYKALENKFNILKENFSTFLIKMKIPKKNKNELTEILKLLDFTENEILFIIDKKKLY